ncbi:MAG: ABC transporter permease [Deltaproteobacteria bacterium]|nr:ABC transporter permease [Deltaproteobacteria bacterium]
MILADLAAVSLKQIYRNRRRYKSVIIGISVGIAGIIIVLTMGDSVEQDLGQNLELLGSATIVKASFDYTKSKKKHGGQYFPKDAKDIEKLPGVKSVSPTVVSFPPFTYKLNKMSGRLLGVEESFFDTIHIPMARGRRINSDDVAWFNSVCVIGDEIARTLFSDNEDPLGKKIFIGGHLFRVVGLIGGVEDTSFLNTIIIPISVGRSRFAEMYEIKNIYVRAVNWDAVAPLHKDLHDLLARNQPGYAESMDIRSFPERIKTIQHAVLLVKVFLYASLFVTIVLGGIGIMNVMLSAVRERTKEIGLRKAVGATETMILSQFLFESVSISLVGAILGILIGFVSVEIMKRLFQTSPAYGVFVISIIGGVIFGVILGIASGIIPAIRASRFDPAESMRFE